MAKAKNIVVQKIEAIHTLLNTWYSCHHGVQDAYYSFQSLTSWNVLLKERGSLEKILELVENNSNHKISFKIREERHLLPDRAGQTSVYPELSDLVPVGVDLYVEEPEKLEAYFKKIIAKVSGNKFDPKKIEVIEIVKNDDESKATIILNEDYLDDSIKVGIKKGLWKTFVEVAESDGVGVESDDLKNVMAYFNYRKECPLYSDSKYDPTNILELKDGLLYCAPKIKIKIMPERSYELKKKKFT